MRLFSRCPAPRRHAGVLAAVTVLAIPFGSLSALQERIVTGTIVDRVSQGGFLRGHRDDPSRVAYQIAFLKQHPPAGPVVYLLGGSAVRECSVSADGLARAIEQTSGVSVRVRVLASSEQKLAATLALIDNLPVGHGGIVVIGLHHTPFAYGQGSATRQLGGDEVLVRSTALRDFLAARLGGDPSASLVPGLRLYLDSYRDKRGVPAFRGPSLTYLQHRYTQAMHWTDAFKRSRVTAWLTGRGRPDGPFYRNFAFNAALLDEAVALARSKGYQVVLMEDSQNAAIVGGAFDPYKEKYRALCDRLVTDYGAHYVNLNRSAGLVNRDFYDLMHLLPSGRLKWQPRLGGRLGEVLVDHPPSATLPLVPLR
jgi:hypothetical protein